jgi:hypothetical protein
MKVGGGLNFVTGPMGAGKSLYATRQIAAAVTQGRYVVTNVELLPGWSERIARHVAPWQRAGTRLELARRLRTYYVFETDLNEAVRYRLPPGRTEGRGLFVWDEGHNDLNNRAWKDEGRQELLRWATQLRKLGFTGYLLTQHGDNTDAALRRVANFHVRLQNQREQTRLLGLRVSPWPLFLAYWYPTHIGQTGARIAPVKIERYFLGWHRHLYDTHGLYHGLALVDEKGADRTIQLGAPADPPAERDGGPVAEPVDASPSTQRPNRPAHQARSIPMNTNGAPQAPSASDRRVKLRAARTR